MAKPNRAAPTADDGDVLLTVADVARLDCCSEKSVRRAIAAGMLDAVRIGPGGRMLRVTRAAHAAYRSRPR